LLGVGCIMAATDEEDEEEEGVLRCATFERLPIPSPNSGVEFESVVDGARAAAPDAGVGS